MNCDILSFDYSSRGRDIDISEPVLSYLELNYNLKIVRKWCFGNHVKDILKYKPKMVIISNGVGSKEHFEIVKFASLRGIKVVTLISEGDYLEDEKSVNEFFWGWNIDKNLYEDLHLEWSSRVLNLIKKYITNVPMDRIKVSGATGFDKYSFNLFMDKESFLRKYKKAKYEKVVGIAGWGFDLLQGEYYKKYKRVVDNRYGEENIRIHLESEKKLISIYKKMIEENKDILFVLKYHPLIVDKKYSEFYNLENYENVLVIVDEENIGNIINISDLWLAYESTTCLEAWLLNKITLLVNPMGGDFKRSKISSGSPVIESYEKLIVCIEQYYNCGEVLEFLKYKDTRKNIIKDIIEYSDGCNHIRAANYVKEIYDKDIIKVKKINCFIIRKLFSSIIISIKEKLINSGFVRKFFDKKYKAYLENMKYFDELEREKNHQLYINTLKEFYNKNNMNV